MTNGEFIETMLEQEEDYCIFKDDTEGTVMIEVSIDWWNKARIESEAEA